MSGDRLVNLESARFLLVAGQPESLDVLAPMIASFGVTRITRCVDRNEARDLLATQTYDAALIDHHLDQGNGHELVSWIRREAPEPNRIMPILFLTANYTKPVIQTAINSGASFAVAKPVAPETLLRSLLWLAETERDFIEAKGYVGPDRRIRMDGLPQGRPGRRANDREDQSGRAMGERVSPGLAEEPDGLKRSSV